MAKKKKSKRKVSAKTKAKRGVKRAEKAVVRAGKKAKRKAKPLGKKVKRGAKKLGKKTKSFAKTDTGRAGIGAGAGALVLGPIGAVAGAAAGLATRNPGRGRKRNVSSFDPGPFGAGPKGPKGKGSKVRGLTSPGSKLARIGLREEGKAKKQPLASGHTRLETSNPEPTAKIASVMGGMLLDYHKASPAIEHVAASALRGERVPFSILMRARNDLHALGKIQKQAAEREQIGDLVDSLDRILNKMSKRKRTSNPVRAFSLETQIKRQRQSRAKKAAIGMTSQSKVYGDVKRKSLAAKLRKINPGHPEWKERFSTLDDLAKNYENARKRWISVSSKPSSSSASLARAQKRMDAAEDKLILYSEMVSLSPRDLKRYLEKRRGKPSTKSRAMSNPKKKKAKKKAAKKKRAKTSEPDRLIRRCQKLWDHYCERPGKSRLKEVIKHLERMEGHASKKVKEERARCMRAAKAEAKKLKLKL